MSRKTNRRVGISFLYFWWYEDGEKYEKYLGRADDKEAELKGLGMMLSFYRRQDEEMHRTIGKLVRELATGGRGKLTSARLDTSIAKVRRDYLPEMED